MPSCELCAQGRADRILGISETLPYLDDEEWLRLERDVVKRACPECATTLVERGVAREMPIDEGTAHEIWYEHAVEITDGELSVKAEYVPDMLGMI